MCLHPCLWKLATVSPEHCLDMDLPGQVSASAALWSVVKYCSSWKVLAKLLNELENYSLFQLSEKFPVYVFEWTKYWDLSST